MYLQLVCIYVYCIFAHCICNWVSSQRQSKPSGLPSSFSFKYFIGKTAAVDSKAAFQYRYSSLVTSIHRSAKRIGLETRMSLPGSPILLVKLTSNHFSEKEGVKPMFQNFCCIFCILGAFWQYKIDLKYGGSVSRIIYNNLNGYFPWKFTYL